MAATSNVKKDLREEILGHSEWAREKCVAAEALNYIEQLEAENEQLKTVPMRYRRLAFNAKLQDENDELRNRVEQLEAENKELRRKLARMNEMLNDVLDMGELS